MRSYQYVRIIIVSLGLVVVYMYSHRILPLRFITTGEGGTSNNDSPGVSELSKLISTAKAISLSNGFVFLVFLNNAYLEMTKSWTCNVLRLVPDVLQLTVYVTTSRGLSAELQVWNPNIRTFCQDYSVSHPVSYGTYEYFRLTEERLRVQNALLQRGVNVMVVESDAAWNSTDIVDFLREKIAQHEIVSADDGQKRRRISAGFLGIRSTSSTRAFFQVALDRYSKTLAGYEGKKGYLGNIQEQKTMTNLLAELGIEVHWLTVCESANGKWYNQRPNPTCPVPMVIQNNYIIGNANKVNRAKKWNQWYLKDNGTCRT